MQEIWSSFGRSTKAKTEAINILQDRNPAQSEFEEVLDQQLKSILSELLGHERGHKYLSYHGFKSHPKHPLVLLLTSGKDGFNSLWTGF